LAGLNGFTFSVLHVDKFNSGDNSHLEKSLICLVLQEKCLHNSAVLSGDSLKDWNENIEGFQFSDLTSIRCT